MQTRPELTIESVREHAVITITGYDPNTRRPIANACLELDQAGVRQLTAQLCACVGLPNPWKKS